MQLLHTRSNLCKWGEKHSTSTVTQLVQMRGGTQYDIHLFCNLCKWGVEHSTMFISYATCANEGWNTVKKFIVMQLVQMRGGTQYNLHWLCNLCKWRQMCKWGVEHSTIFICHATYVDEVDSCGGTQCEMSNYNSNQAIHANNWSWNAWVKVIQLTVIKY